MRDDFRYVVLLAFLLALLASSWHLYYRVNKLERTLDEIKDARDAKEAKK